MFPKKDTYASNKLKVNFFSFSEVSGQSLRPTRAEAWQRAARSDELPNL